MYGDVKRQDSRPDWQKLRAAMQWRSGAMRQADARWAAWARARPRRPPRMADETAQARGRVLGSREPWPGAEPTRQDCRFKWRDRDGRRHGVASARRWGTDRTE